MESQELVRCRWSVLEVMGRRQEGEMALERLEVQVQDQLVVFP